MQKLVEAVFCTLGTVKKTSGGVQKLSGAVFLHRQNSGKLTILHQINGELVLGNGKKNGKNGSDLSSGV
ncbi:MAG: hypothetical protein AB7S75_17680 [Desulfococcaceae bacterium]